MNHEPLPAQGPVDVNVSHHDCYSEDGAPVKCWKCGSMEQREEVRSMVDVLHGQGPVCEYEVFCAECGMGIGYWAYGSFDPGYMRDMMANALAQGPGGSSPGPAGATGSAAGGYEERVEQ